MAAVAALELPSMRCRLLLQKLHFLTMRRLSKDDAVGVGPELLHACADGVGSVCLVKECCLVVLLYSSCYRGRH